MKSHLERLARAVTNRAIVTLRELFRGVFSDAVVGYPDVVDGTDLDCFLASTAGGRSRGRPPTVVEAMQARLLQAAHNILPIPPEVTGSGSLVRLAGERARDPDFLLRNRLPEYRPRRAGKENKPQ